MRPFVAALLVAFAAALTASADPVVQEKKEKPKEEKSNAEKLVGKWKLTNTDAKVPDGFAATVEYTKDGKMIIRIEVGDNKVEMKGTYKLDKDKIDYKVTLPNGDDKTEILTIKKLTDDELVTTDPDGIKEEFKRAKDEKKKDEKKK